MTMVNLHIASISVIISTTIILGVGIVSIALTELGNFGIAQGQVSDSTSSSSLTPQQKAAICNPNNPKLNFVNSTESEICGILPMPTNTTTTPAANNTRTIAKQSLSLYEQGYTKGVADSKSVQVTTPSTGTMMSPDDVDCDSSIDPQASNQDYCSGYQHGYTDTYNKELVRK
jgi:hypothetical protein